MTKRMSFTATGDSLIQKHIPMPYEGLDKLISFIGQGEAKITNLETTLSDGDCFPSSFSGGTWLTTSPTVLEDLDEFGFNLYGCANNHTLDYSYEGLYSTLDYLKQYEINYAGIGMNLHEASKPAMIDLPSGRVAFISICSTFDATARAGSQGPVMPGRPGLNPLRFSITNKVTQAHLDVLKEIAKATDLNAYSDMSISQGFKLPPPEGTWEFGNINFSVCETEAEEGKFSTPNKADVERTVHSIKDALRVCDYVVVMVHSHEIKGADQSEADYFFESFAHSCIDAGASVIFGGGTHQLKGIEMYNGKPIFYSLGNFIFQNEYVAQLPPDFMEKYKIPIDSTAAEGIATRAGYSTGTSMHQHKPNFFSVVPYIEFEEDKCIKINMLPIDLGMKKERSFKNIPYPADEEMTQEVFDYLKKASKKYGTKLSLSDKGMIKVSIK